MFAFCPIPPLISRFLCVQPHADVHLYSCRDLNPPTISGPQNPRKPEIFAPRISDVGPVGTMASCTEYIGGYKERSENSFHNFF